MDQIFRIGDAVTPDMFLFPLMKAGISIVALMIFMTALLIVARLFRGDFSIMESMRSHNTAVAIIYGMIAISLAILLGSILGCSQKVAVRVPPINIAIKEELTLDDHFRTYAELYFPIASWKWFKAQAMAESAMDPKAVSSEGARGLMQFMPATAIEWGLNDPFDPERSIWAGIRYDAWIDRFVRKRGFAFEMPTRMKPVFAGYNWGPGNIIKSMNQMDDKDIFNPWLPKETRGYIKRIFKFKDQL